jgi:hypothetical protein
MGKMMVGRKCDDQAKCWWDFISPRSALCFVYLLVCLY